MHIFDVFTTLCSDCTKLTLRKINDTNDNNVETAEEILNTQALVNEKAPASVAVPSLDSLLSTNIPYEPLSNLTPEALRDLFVQLVN